MCMGIGIILPSCENVTDDYSIMEDYYVESVQLPTVSLDSVKSFSNKIDGYVTVNPLAKEHRRYSQILANIKAASIRMVIDVDTIWDGERHISF